MLTLPNTHGRFGKYGGSYVPETLMPALLELEQAYLKARRDRRFQAELDRYLKLYVGRPTPLYFAEKLTRRVGGGKIYLKRQDPGHTGAHQVHNTLGQGLLDRREEQPPAVRRTGAGQD